MIKAGQMANTYLSDWISLSVGKSFLAKDDKENTISENKMKSLLEVMEGFKEQPVNKQMLQKVMKIQQLIKEINN